MDTYKVALLIDPNYAGNIPTIVEEIRPTVTYVFPVKTPDCTYRLYYWDEAYHSGTAVSELISELGHVRHAIYQVCNEDGQVFQDNLIEDDFGVDEEIENILDIEQHFTVFDMPMFQEIPYERLLEILKAYISDDLANACDHEYVPEKLRDICGCSKEELDILDLI